MDRVQISWTHVDIERHRSENGTGKCDGVSGDRRGFVFLLPIVAEPSCEDFASFEHEVLHPRLIFGIVASGRELTVGLPPFEVVGDRRFQTSLVKEIIPIIENDLAHHLLRTAHATQVF